MGGLDFGIEMKDRAGEIILNNCKIHFDPDNSAQHYLERGVSREAFFRFAGQIGEIMLKCMEEKMTVDLDLRHIRMENDVPNFSVCIGESGLTDINQIHKGECFENSRRTNGLQSTLKSQ